MLGGMHELSRLDMMQDANRHMDGILMFLMFFSDQFSYKILCISSYGLRDMNFASLEHQGTNWAEPARFWAGTWTASATGTSGRVGVGCAGRKDGPRPSWWRI
jgi:hypothetical protein